MANGGQNILYTTTGVPEEQSLRHIIHTRFPDGMPQDFIAIIMRDVLAALNFLHVSESAGHKDVNSRNICVDTEQDPTTIMLAVDEGKDLAHHEPGWEEGGAPTDDILHLGITALEMGYGSVPRPGDGNALAHWLCLVNNMIRILKLKLAYPDKKGKEKAKNKGKESEVSDVEPKKSTIKLPVLGKLMSVGYVEFLEKKLKKKKAMAVLTEKFKKAVNFFRKNKNGNADEGEFSIDNADDREFSRDFLEVVLMCLEQQKTAAQIQEHPFFPVEH